MPRGKVEDLELNSLSTVDADRLKVYASRLLAGEVFMEELEKNRFVPLDLHNVFISRCFNCKKLSLWHGKRLLQPSKKFGAIPNLDINEDIRADMEEAREIMEASPRGAAALLRLALQKLCAQLGEPGKNIDSDIKSLVAKGLDPHLQEAFDIVRVLGNEAVHPGTMDLRDDTETAAELINLINIVAQTMITNKKAISALYARLPQNKIAGIIARDKTNT